MRFDNTVPLMLPKHFKEGRSVDVVAFLSLQSTAQQYVQVYIKLP